jgi:hypothetical protein
MTDQELDELEADAKVYTMYGSRMFPASVVLRLIKEIRRLRADRDYTTLWGRNNERYR